MPTINNNNNNNNNNNINNNKMTQRVRSRSGVSRHIDRPHSMCSCCLGSHRQKPIVCRKTAEIPHPKPDVSMLLALERKRLVFRGGSFCDDKTNAWLREETASVVLDPTNKKNVA